MRKDGSGERGVFQNVQFTAIPNGRSMLSGWKQEERKGPDTRRGGAERRVRPVEGSRGFHQEAPSLKVVGKGVVTLPQTIQHATQGSAILFE